MSGEKRCAIRVIDQLNVDVIQRAINIEPWTLGSAHHLLADAGVNVTPIRIF
jgi:hypothetical protein